MVVLVDSGILLRLLEPSDPRAAIRGAVRALQTRGHILVTAAQNVTEFRNVRTRPATARGGYGLSIADADRRRCVIERLFHVLLVSPAAYQPGRGLLVAHILMLNKGDFVRYTGIVPIAPTGLPPPPRAIP